MMLNFSQLSFKKSKRELFQMRSERFNSRRKIEESMEQEVSTEIVESMEDVDYHTSYPEQIRKGIDQSLKMKIPTELPPLDLLTISLYRRAGKSVYQCRRSGCKQIDPHMAYESLLMLAHKEAKYFGNWNALVKEFQRDFRAYLTYGSKDLREMAIVAAGNKILGKQEDVLKLVAESNLQCLWVLINHTYENKIHSRYMLPFLLAKNELAFKTFSELTANMRDESIMILAESDEAIDCLMEALAEPGALCKLSLRIISNILGEGEGHWKLFYYSKLLEVSVKLLHVSDASLKFDLIAMLYNFVCEPEAATAVLRNEGLISQLVSLLSGYGALSQDLKKQLLNTFSFIVYKAEQQEVFQKLMGRDLMEICSGMMSFGDDITLSALQLVCGLVELGQKFPNEEGTNIASMLVKSNGMLQGQIEELSLAKNNYVSGLSFTILERMEGSEEL